MIVKSDVGRGIITEQFRPGQCKWLPGECVDWGALPGGVAVADIVAACGIDPKEPGIQIGTLKSAWEIEATNYAQPGDLVVLLRDTIWLIRR